MRIPERRPALFLEKGERHMADTQTTPGTYPPKDAQKSTEAFRDVPKDIWIVQSDKDVDTKPIITDWASI